MGRCMILFLLVAVLILPVTAISGEAPALPEEAQNLMPEVNEDFLSGVLEILQNALNTVSPVFQEAAGACLGVLATTVICGIFQTQTIGQGLSASNLLGVGVISMILLQSAQTFLRLGLETVERISTYGELLLPVMSAALVASGGASKASALYMGTAFCDSLLNRLLSQGIAPLIYLFLATGIASCALGNDLLGRMNGFFKSCITWGMKTVLYVFTGYMTITGVISGTADAAALKATKLTISGMVPVVGGILSDASEAILVGAGAVRSTVGIGGMLALFALTAAPFLQAGVQYILLKLTAACCGVLGTKEHAALTESFAQAMGMIMGMIGTCCLLQLISAVCFMKGVG